MSALHVSRRTAFGLAGAASATVALAACSNGDGKDYSGEVKFRQLRTLWEL